MAKKDEKDTAEDMTADATPAQPAPAQSDKIYSQAEVDQMVKDRLARQRAQFSDYDDLKSQASELAKLREDHNKLQTERDSLQSDFNAASRDAVALKIALERGLPMELVPRMQGDTEDDLAKDADQLLGLVRQPGPRRSFDGGQQGVVSGTAESADMALRRAMGH